MPKTLFQILFLEGLRITKVTRNTIIASDGLPIKKSIENLYKLNRAGITRINLQTESEQKQIKANLINEIVINALAEGAYVLGELERKHKKTLFDVMPAIKKNANPSYS